MSAVTAVIRLDMSDEFPKNDIEALLRAKIEALAGLEVQNIRLVSSADVPAVKTVDTVLFLSVLRHFGGIAPLTVVRNVLAMDLVHLLPGNAGISSPNTWYRRAVKLKDVGLVLGGHTARPIRQRQDGQWECVNARPSEYMAITKAGLEYLSRNADLIPAGFLEGLATLPTDNLPALVRTLGLLMTSAMDEAPQRVARQPRTPRA